MSKYIHTQGGISVIIQFIVSKLCMFYGQILMDKQGLEALFEVPDPLPPSSSFELLKRTVFSLH